MSTFLRNLARRGVGLHQNVQPRAPVGVSSAPEAEGSLEVEAEERASEADKSAPYVEVTRPSEMVEDAFRTGEQSEHSRMFPRTPTEAASTSAILEDTSVGHRSEFQTVQRDVGAESTPRRLAQLARDEGPTPIRNRKHLPHNNPDIAASMTSQEELTPATEARPDQPNPLAAGSFSTERNNLDAESQVDFIMARERHLVGEPAVTKTEEPGHALRLDARSADDGLGPASNASWLEPQTQLEQADTSVARPLLDKFPFPVDREAVADPSNSAYRQIDGLIDRLGVLIDRFEANQKASQRPPFHSMPQPRQRPPVRGFGELASLRRHAARRWS